MAERAGRLVVALAIGVLTGVTAVLLVPALVLADLVRWLCRPRPPGPRPLPPRSGGASVIIPTFDGRDLLAECLPALRMSVARLSGPGEIIVVDNGSGDGSVRWLQTTYPDVRVVARPTNEGFSRACNHGAAVARHPILVFLNNDMVVDPLFLPRLLEGFTDASVFAVSAQIFFQDKERRREETGFTRGELRAGAFLLAHAPPPAGAPAATYAVLYAGGGSGAYRRDLFLELGGFDPFYAPFYYEDLDLSYRARKAGWQVLLTPASHVYHRHRGTVGRLYAADRIDAIRLKNEWRFVARNVTDWRLLAPYLLRRPWTWARHAFHRPHGCLPELLALLGNLPALVARRLRTPTVRSDRVVLETGVADPSPSRPTTVDRSLSLLIVTPHYPFPLSHGGAVRMYNYIKQLAARGHRVSLVAFIEQEEERQHLDALAPYCVDVRQIRRRPSRPRFPVRYFAFSDYYDAEVVAAIRELTAKHPFDIVQLEFTEMGQYEWVPRRDARVIMVEIDVAFVTHWRRAWVERGWGRRLRLLAWAGLIFDAEVSAARAVDHLFMMSKVDAQFLRRFVPSTPMSIVPNGVDTRAHRYEPPASDPTPILVFVGYFPHPPNVEAVRYFARRVFPTIRARMPSVRWTIVGQSPPPDVLRLATKDSGIQVLGYVDDLAPIYRQSRVFLAPILRGSGTRLKILEAMARGVPVVSTTVGYEGIAATPDHDILVADSPADFAAQVLRLLEDLELARKLSLNARRLVEREYDYAVLAERLEAVYWRVVRDEVGRALMPGLSSRRPVPSGRRPHA